MKTIQNFFRNAFYGLLPVFVMAYGLFLSACSSDEPTVSEDDFTIETEIKMQVYVYPGIKRSDGVVPRMTVVGENAICTEYYDPDQPEVYVFHCMDTSTRKSFFLTASEKGLTIMEDDPFRPTSSPNMSLIVKEGKEIVIFSGTYSKSDEAFTVTSVQRIEGETSGTVKARTRGDDMDFARELVMKDIIQPLSSKIAEAQKVTGSKLPHFKGADNALTIISDVGLVAAEAHLYSNDEKAYNKKFEEYVYRNLKKRYKVIQKVEDSIIGIRNIYGAALSVFNEGISFDDYDDDMSEEFILTTTDSYSFTSRRAQEVVWEVYDDSQAYKPTVSLVNVKGQSASVRGNFSNYDGRFTVTGYYLYHNGAEVEKVSDPLNGSVYTFTNLAKGENYSVTAFATVMGATYESLPVHFRIEGDLELSEYNLTFSDVGGKASVQVTLPSDEWIWNAASNAKWCKAIPAKGTTLNVEASSSSESREAVVTVTATSPKGETQTRTINVQQKSIGSFAVFQGTCTLINKCTYPSSPEDNFTNKHSVDALLLMTKLGSDTNLTFSLPLSGISFSNWKVSNSRPTGPMVVEGYSITNFNCSSGVSGISIDGSTRGPDNSENEFSVKIDLATLTVKILEGSKSEGTAIGGGFYKALDTFSGTLYYTEKYNN